MQAQTESPYLDYTRAAAFCGLHRITLWRAVKAGDLRASGPGRAVRFHRDELGRWMDSRNRKETDLPTMAQEGGVSGSIKKRQGGERCKATSR